MKEALQAIIEAIVSDKSAVLIEEKQEENTTIFEVKVAESDMGKVIGKEGRIAKAIRVVIKAIASREQKKVSVEFIG